MVRGLKSQTPNPKHQIPNLKAGSPKGWNVNSRGCNPRFVRPGQSATLKGSNWRRCAGLGFGPCRAGRLTAPASVGCRPRLFTWKPFGFRKALPLACTKLGCPPGPGSERRAGAWVVDAGRCSFLVELATSLAIWVERIDFHWVLGWREG